MNINLICSVNNKHFTREIIAIGRPQYTIPYTVGIIKRRVLSLYAVGLSYNLLTLRIKELRVRSSVAGHMTICDVLSGAKVPARITNEQVPSSLWLCFITVALCQLSLLGLLFTEVWNASYCRIASFLISNLNLYSFSSNWILHLLT